MTASNHENQHHQQQSSRNKGLHKDWRVWAVVLLMLAAMAIYVLSDNESLRFGNAKPIKPAPANAGGGNEVK